MKRRLSRIWWSAGAVALTAACGDDAATPRAPETSAAERSEPAVETDPAEALYALAERHARAVLEVSPEAATSLGVSEAIAGEGYLSRLGDYGFEASERAREMNERFLQELRAIDRAALAGDALVTFDVLMNAYEAAARRNEFGLGGAAEFGSSRPNSGSTWAATPYMVTQLTGPHLFLPRMMQTQHPIDDAAGADAYLARLEEFGRVFDEVIETVNADAGAGATPPAFVLKGAINAIAGLTAPAPGEHPLTLRLIERTGRVDAISEEDRARYAAEAARLVETVVYPAYSRLSAALENLVDQAGTDAGVWRLGEMGEAYYQFTLDSYGGGGRTGDEIHELGLAEVERITAEMDRLLKSIDLTEGSVAARMRQLAAREDNLFPNTDEGREALLELLREQVAAVNAVAPDWFASLPEQSVEVRRIPVYEQDSAPGGYYSGPSLDGTRPGIYWINLKSTADNPIHSLKTLTYHEAVPGHHFQISSQQSVENLPLIRNMLSYSEYTEGWALYAEELAKEMGMYEDDPEGDLGRLQAEIFRAARLVVDSGLHTKRWTREQAIDYMAEATGETRASVSREIERYAAVPGQACAYKLGMLRIGELRARAEEELGENFDIRRFHEAVLTTGAAPLPVLERRIVRWIEKEKG